MYSVWRWPSNFNERMYYTSNSITSNIIAKEVINLLKPQMCKMLCILHIPHNKDVEMRELIFYLGEISKSPRI
jgi:hypothetical protein